MVMLIQIIQILLDHLLYQHLIIQKQVKKFDFSFSMITKIIQTFLTHQSLSSSVKIKELKNKLICSTIVDKIALNLIDFSS
jgi:hypothetical protein